MCSMSTRKSFSAALVVKKMWSAFYCLSRAQNESDDEWIGSFPFSTKNKKEKKN